MATLPPWALGIGAGIGALALYLMARPSPHFSWDELQTTSQPYDNTPDFSERMRLIRLAWSVLEPLRNEFGPIRITSGFRSQTVNDAVGGSPTSYHRRGMAADLYSGSTHEEMATWLYDQRDRLPLNEVIVERHTGHLHVAVNTDGSPLNKFLQTSDGKSYQTWAPA